MPLTSLNPLISFTSDYSIKLSDNRKLLPEVCVEGCAKSDNEESTYDIKPSPTLTDRLLEVGCKGDSLHLFLARSGSETAHYHHEYQKEHEQPALKYQPVGLPEPCCGISESSVHGGLASIGDDVGDKAEHTDKEAHYHGVLTRLRSNLL